MSGTSFYALELCIPPGGGRHADCFVYNDPGHIAELLRDAFIGAGGRGPNAHISLLAFDNELAAVIWVVQGGEVSAEIDLAPMIQLCFEDGSKQTLEQIHQGPSSLEAFASFELDVAAIVAALPPLEPPLLRAGWATSLRRLPRSASKQATGFSYMRHHLRQSGVSLRYGYQSFEGDRGSPLRDCDPPSSGDLREQLGADDLDAVDDVLERALASADLELAAAAIERLQQLGGDTREVAVVEARARLDELDNKPGHGLLRLLRLAIRRGVAIHDLGLRVPGLVASLRAGCEFKPEARAALLDELRRTPTEVAQQRTAAMAEHGNCRAPAQLLTRLAELLGWPGRAELLGAAAALYFTDEGLVAEVRGQFDAAQTHGFVVGGLAWALLALAYTRRGQTDEALAAWTHASKLERQATIPRLERARLSGRSLDPDAAREWTRLPARGHELDRHLLAWLEHDPSFDRSSLGPAGASSSSSAGDAKPGLSIDQVRVGTAVKHAKFGLGTVGAIVLGDNPKLVIEFEEGGKRTLLLRFIDLA